MGKDCTLGPGQSANTESTLHMCLFVLELGLVYLCPGFVESGSGKTLKICKAKSRRASGVFVDVVPPVDTYTFDLFLFMFGKRLS